MNWDPITRIVGSLGIYTKIDFANREVAECHSTSSIFRGYSIFMKGKDPRDAHFITSRICGICGDNHATCAIYAQNMAFGVKPPAMAEWIVNLGEAAEYMFDHNIFQDNLVGVDFCEQMVKETNPGVLAKAEQTAAPHADLHGYKTIADIMRALNPFTGSFYRETLHVSRYTREMFCLMEGRHVHPSTLYPGGVGTVPTVQLFTDYLVRLMRYVEFMKKCLPLHEDLFNFWYEALPGYEEVGRRRILLGCWGSFNDPDVCDYTYKNMNHWGNAMFVTPGRRRRRQAGDHQPGRHQPGTFASCWAAPITTIGTTPRCSSRTIRWAIRSTSKHPWNQTTIPRPQKRDFKGKYTWVMSPRWYDKRTGDHLALDTGGGPIARLWATALAGKVDIGYIKSTGQSVKIYLPKTATLPEVEFEWKIPAVEQRHRARSGADLLPGLCRRLRAALRRKSARRIACRPDENLDRVQGARRSDRLRFPRGGARRPLASRRDSQGQDRQLSSLSADSLERQPARHLRHAGPLRRRRAKHPDLRGEWSREFQGNRHHAGGPQLRSLPAVRRPHVCRPRQGGRAIPFADLRHAPVRLDDSKRAGTLHNATRRPRQQRETFACREEADFQRRMQRIESLVHEIESVADPRVQSRAVELVSLLMELHGAGHRPHAGVAGPETAPPPRRPLGNLPPIRW